MLSRLADDLRRKAAALAYPDDMLVKSRRLLMREEDEGLARQLFHADAPALRERMVLRHSGNERKGETALSLQPFRSEMRQEQADVDFFFLQGVDDVAGGGLFHVQIDLGMFRSEG